MKKEEDKKKKKKEELNLFLFFAGITILILAIFLLSHFFGVKINSSVFIM